MMFGLVELEYIYFFYLEVPHNLMWMVDWCVYVDIDSGLRVK